MKVFYSWQSDTPNKIGRAFIREALDEAISSLDLEEADRPEVDQDTQGVMGSPVIAETIFQKIRAARVVIADVTLTGETPKGKRLCNSNVAIELGYALGSKGDEVLLKIMNTYYGPPEDLPFDLAHRRWPVQFSLSPDASKPDRELVRNALTIQLRKILELYIAVSRPQPEVFTPTPSSYSPAAYWTKNEPLATIAIQPAKNVPLQFGDWPLAYLRIWPTAKIAPLSIQILSDYGKSTIEPFCGGVSGWSYERNRFGVLTYATQRSATELASITQVFKSGEIWGISAHILRKQEGYPNLVPTIAYERGLRISLNKYLHVARSHFGYPAKITVESGLTNMAGFKLAMSNHNFWGPIYENDVRIEVELDMDEPTTINDALLRIFESVFEAAGHPRPINLDNFPEGQV